MTTQRTTRNRAGFAAAAVVLAAAVAGCGGGTASGNGHASASSQIRQDWTAFFSAKTPASRRVALLQDGSAFSALIRSQSGSALAKEASAKVVSVKTTTSSKQATVTYDVLLGGAPVLKNQKGTAVLQHGTWKVGTASFCSLLALQGGGKAPSACASAGG